MRIQTLWDILSKEDNQLQGGNGNNISHQATLHQLVFDYFPITALLQVFYSLHTSTYVLYKEFINLIRSIWNQRLINLVYES